MTLRAVAITIEELDASDEEQMDAWQDVRAETDRDINPHDPPAPVDELRLWLTKRTSQGYVRGWLASVDGVAVGEASFEFETTEANRHILSSDWLAVRPAYRRRGVADALLREVLTAARADEMTTLVLWSHESDPDVGRAYAERLGLTQGTAERCSRVAVAEIDGSLIESWIEAGRSRTDGYRIVQFGERCPDEYLRAYLEASGSMSDMPTDDLEWSVPTIDEEAVRTREAVWAASKTTLARTLALAPDGSGAGISELYVNGYRPSLADQGDTGVVASHRGHGLGRWLKAENLRFAQRLVPGFAVIETYNAQSNPWMLDINVAMGFRPHVAWRGFQGDLARALEVVSTP